MPETPRWPSHQTLSRSLLIPGPQPPLSHLGASLMRHVTGTVVRYSLYQLGLPMPDGPPVRIVRLRILLEATPLLAVLRGDPAGPEVLEALLHPRGAGRLSSDAGRVRAAASLHRARLAALGPRRGRAARAASRAGAPAAPATQPATMLSPPQAAVPLHAGATPPPAAVSEPSLDAARTARTRAQLWADVCSVVAGRMPYLCDAALGELVTTLGRRRLRHFGRRVGGALGQVALQAHLGRDADLRALGPLDPAAPSWAEAGLSTQEVRARAERARGGAALPPRSSRRGGFREAYRWVLSEVRPLLLELGARAREDGIVDHPGDIFFVPFELGAELGGQRRPSWLAPAVAANRREHEALLAAPEPADEIEGPPQLAPLLDRSPDWDISPLLLVE